MDYSRLRMARNGLGFSIALTASAFAQANSTTVEIIFAAENALYGAGYDIGQADGWMDATLKTALRKYQSKHASLADSGNLDTATLAMLGVSATANKTVSGNDVAQRADALSLLGISAIKTKPELKQKPQPEPTPTERVAKTTPRPVTQKPPQPILVQPDPAPKPKAEPAPVARKPKSQPVSVPTIAYSTENTSKVKADPVVTASVAPLPTKDEPLSPAPQITEAPTAAEIPEAPPVEVIADEPASEPSQPAPEPPENRTNIFGSLFNFFFGWMG